MLACARAAVPTGWSRGGLVLTYMSSALRTLRTNAGMRMGAIGRTRGMARRCHAGRNISDGTVRTAFPIAAGGFGGQACTNVRSLEPAGQSDLDDGFPAQVRDAAFVAATIWEVEDLVEVWRAQQDEDLREALEEVFGIDLQVRGQVSAHAGG
eukprot:CAMPEP_0171066256 /NCGR_PEP_ID=MMETSP0766_2-20121228/7316_1 /TAXON_ID=439317 /ORGANISM="Gambierdiscus australes, Strain CAWD 149" /LENGTH=152 /DNA_ID=CAMNT_0011522413 /DNA_START=451 /DNA_END=909 /DNA_ORIENTATION=+